MSALQLNIKDATFTLATYRYPFPSPRTTKADADFDDPVEFVLKEWPAPSHCKWPRENEAYYELKVVE